MTYIKELSNDMWVTNFEQDKQFVLLNPFVYKSTTLKTFSQKYANVSLIKKKYIEQVEKIVAE